MSTVELDGLLAGRAPANDEERRLAAAISALRAAPPRAPERLREHVAELRSQPQRGSLPSRRRALLVVVPAAAAAAVVAAAVHGLRSPQVHVQHGAVAAAGTHDSLRKLAPSVAATPEQAVGGSGATTFSPAGARLQRYEASLTLRVGGNGKLSDATTAATRVVQSLGGYAASIVYRTPQGRAGEAFLELRVPTARVQAALARLSSFGQVLSQRVSIQDLQHDLEVEAAQIAQLRREVKLLASALESSSLTPLQRIELRLKLGAARRALAQRTHARRATVAEGTLARVSLVLTAAKPAAAAPRHEGRLHRMLGSAVSFLGLEGTILLYALIVVAPLVPIVALGWWAVGARRRRDERRLLAAN